MERRRYLQREKAAAGKPLVRRFPGGLCAVWTGAAGTALGASENRTVKCSKHALGECFLLLL